MSDARATLLLQIRSDLAGLRQAMDEFNTFRQQTKAASGELAKFGSDFKSTMAAGLGLGTGFAAGASAANAIIGTLRQVTDALKDGVNEGVRFNATLESARFSIAAVLKQFDGERYKNFGDAIKASDGLISELKSRAKETAATFQELLEGYRATAGVMTAAGVPLNKQIALLTTTSQAMSALGISAQELRQELTALLMANIDRNARLGKTLESTGLTNETIARAKEEGRVFELLTKSMSEFAAAGKLSADTVQVLESNLKDIKTDSAADATKNLTDSYKELLRVQTDFAQSANGKQMLGMWANIKAVVQAVSGKGIQLLSGNSGSSVGAVGRAESDVAAFTRQASDVRSQADIDTATAAGLTLVHELNASARLKSASAATKERLLELADATFREVKTLEQGGAARIKINQQTDEANRKQVEANKLAAESEKAREEGAKRYQQMQEKERAAVLAAAKQSDPATYLRLLKADKGTFETALRAPEASSEFYLRGVKNPTPDIVTAADRSAAAYRMDINAKLKDTEREIAAAQDAQAKKEKSAADEKLRAEVRYLQVKAQDGTLTEKVAALEAEKNALDKSSVTYKADELAIEFRIAKLKEDEAAKARAEAARISRFNDEAKINAIRQNQFLTDRERRQQLYLAFKREEQGYDDKDGHHLSIDEKIKAAEGLVKSSNGSMKAQAQSELDALNQRKIVGLPGDLEQNKPLSWIDETKVALASLKDGFRTVATSIADVMGSTISSLSSGLQGLFNGTMTLGQAVDSVWVGVGQSISRVIADMVAQWIVQHTIMAAWSKLFAAEDVATHTAAEGAKVTASGVGAGVRAGIASGETATVSGLKVAEVGVHVAGEATKTSSTLLGGVIRIGVAIKEAIASVFTAGVGALQAMASIPYVGPILAVAAMGAVIAAGMGIVKGISKGFKKGGYTGAGDPNEVAGSVHYEEVVFNKDDVRRHGGVAAVEALRVRGGGLGDTGPVMSSFRPIKSGGAYSSNGGQPQSVNHIAFFNTQQDAEQWLNSQRGSKVMIDFMRQRSSEVSNG